MSDQTPDYKAVHPVTLLTLIARLLHHDQMVEDQTNNTHHNNDVGQAYLDGIMDLSCWMFGFDPFNEEEVRKLGDIIAKYLLKACEDPTFDDNNPFANLPEPEMPAWSFSAGSSSSGEPSSPPTSSSSPA